MADSSLTTNPTAVKASQEAIEAKKEQEKFDADVRKKSKTISTRTYRYPNNLDTTEQPHSVNFFISEYVPGATREQLVSSAAANNALGAPSTRSGNGITAENAKNVEQNLRFGVAFIGSLAGQAVGAKVGEAFGSLGKFLGQVAGGVGTAVAVDQLVSKDATSIKSAPALRITDAISLHIAQSPQAKYTAEYENESIGALLGTLTTSAGSGVLGSLMTEAASGNLGELIARGMVDAATLPKELGLGNVNLSGLARAASKKVRNPYQEQIFKTMNFRSFAFQYKFAPRNKGEFDSVMNIINLFKYHMHPMKDDGGAFFVFPSVFDIEYRYNGERNKFVNKIATSVLTDMSVDYGSEGVFTTFRGQNGAPSEITLAMQFREIVLLTKDKNGNLTDGTNGGGF